MLIERTNKECLERTEMAKEGEKQTFVHRTTVLTTECTIYSPCSSHHSSPFSFVLIFASHYEASSFVCRRQPPVNHSLTHSLTCSLFLTPADSMLRHACLREHEGRVGRVRHGSDLIPGLRESGFLCQNIPSRTVNTHGQGYCPEPREKGVSCPWRWETSGKK